MENFFLTDELRMMRDTVRRFIQKEVVPIELEIGHYVTEVPAQYVTALQKKARDMGCWQMGALREWGGEELDIFSQFVLMEEASQHWFGLVSPAMDAFGKTVPTVLSKLNTELVEKLVKPAVESGNGCFIALDNSSNFTARKSSNGQWIISGSQRFVANADKAGFGLIWAKVEDSKETMLFLVENNGSVKYKEVVLVRTIGLFDISIQDCEVSAENCLGKGGELAGGILNEYQVLLAASCLGVSREALRLCSEYATQRETFGKLLEYRNSIQDMVADSIVELSSARLLVWSIVKKMSLGDASENEVAMAKLVATETAFKIIDRSIQIHGGMGVAQEVPVERWYREIRLARLMLESSEKIRHKLAVAEFEKYHK